MVVGIIITAPSYVLAMDANSLEQVLQSADNVAEWFRTNGVSWQPYVFADEHTNWIEEQRAVREACAVVDQSYHMEIIRIEGPEAVDLLASLGVNDFDKMRHGDPPQALDLLVCNPDGYIIGDNILFYVGEEEFTLVGTETINNWIRYNAETREFDARAEVLYHMFDDRDPPEFRFQIQGPDALAVMEDVVDGTLPDISFFEMDTIEIDGTETFALGHGMAAFAGLEIFGPYEQHDEVLQAILAAGREYDIRQMGRKAYKTGKIGQGWFAFSLPAIYEHEDLQGYREWLGADSLEAQLSIGGSFDSRDITDYYMTPMERAQTHLIDFDHEFVGRDALAEMVDDQQRERVTLVWESEDVIDVYASLFREGETNKYVDMPDIANQWSTMHYDEVRKDGDVIGISKYPGYLYYERELLSISSVDTEYADPGTEVTFVWGDTSGKPSVERHEPVEIRATVAEAPYVRGGRRSM
jgi:vanillate/3-O-methylgallate O-demethylase